MTHRITLPWPAPALWQNRRVHWRIRSKATREARKAAWALAVKAKVPHIPDARLRFTFHPPDARRLDIQNMPATQKAAIDGIADAMGCDDAGFRPIWPEAFAEARPGGAVIVEIIDDAGVTMVPLRGVVT